MLTECVGKCISGLGVKIISIFVELNAKPTAFHVMFEKQTEEEFAALTPDGFIISRKGTLSHTLVCLLCVVGLMLLGLLFR